MTAYARALLGASTRRERERREDDDELAAAPRAQIPGKLRADEDDGPPARDPGKRSRADDPAALDPGRALAFTEWMLGAGPIDRRAERAVDDEDGALAAAFDFLRDARAGQSLPDELRRWLEAELGLDLGAVRLHTDARAAAAAAALGARAFTLGDDVYFAAGAFAPDTDAGVELIAHEIHHVAQQRGERGRAARVSRPGDDHEREADAFAARFRAGHRATPEPGDPASLVEHVRRQGQRIQLPHLAELEAELGASLSSVEAFTGDAAALACRLMSAAAFAVRNVVAFADPSPRREHLLHELTHVVQMGNRAAPEQFGFGSLRVSDRRDPAEVEASHGGGATVAADPDTVHRTDGTLPTTRLERWQTFRDTWIANHMRQLTPDRVGEARFGWNEYLLPDGTKTYQHRYLVSSSVPFMLDDYRRELGYDNTRADDLTELYASTSASTIGLAKVREDGQKWAWLGEPPYQAVVADILEVARTNPEPWQQWKTYSTWLEALVPLKGRMTMPVGLPPPDANATSGYTRDEATKFRNALYQFIAEQYSTNSGEWTEFYDQIVTQAPFSENTAMVGNAFEEVVKRTLVGETAAEAMLRPHFDLPGGESNRLRTADGEVLNYDKQGHNLILECKAYQLERGSDGAPVAHRTLSDALRTQAEDYARVIGVFGGGSPLPGFDREGNSRVNRRYFNHVTYVFPTAEVASQWARDLNAIFPEGTLTILPTPGARPFQAETNPTFTFYLDEQQTSHHLVNPPVFHPGLTVTALDVNLNASGELASGTITLQPTLGDAMTTEAPETKSLTATEQGGHFENGLTGVDSPTLSRYLSPERFTVNTRLTDDGVEATLGITAGASGIPSFNLEASSLTVRYGAGGLTIEGELGLAHTSGKLSARVTVGWDGTDWTFNGSATVAAGIVEGLSAFTAQVRYENGQWSIGCESVSYERTIGAITLTGTARGVWYDVDAGTFSGIVGLEADLGMFGRAVAEAEIADSALASARLSYDSPELKYPKDSETPAFRGTLGGTVTYEDGQFSGAIRGTANLNIPALQVVAGEAGIGLAVDAQINADGSYGGTVATTTPLTFGDHLEVPSISCTIGADGAMSGAFEIRIVDIKYLEDASIQCTVDATGVHIADASVSVAFGEQGTGQFWGTLTAGYSEAAGLSVGGQVNYQIKEGMIATGTLTYDNATGSVSLSMTVSEIQLLDSTVSKQLFNATKQIPVFTTGALGVYLDLGFELGFDFGFDLGVQPTVEFEGLSLETFEFTRIQAQLALLGEIYARLTGTPTLGLGIFALSPSILRGGGGVRIPIVGEARITPTGTISLTYTPDGGVEGDATVGMAMTFGISGSVTPYAELAVLDGMFNPSWQGDALTSFEILPPKEIFNFTIDLAGDMTTRTPELPEENAAGEPTTPEASTVLPEEHGTETQHEGPAASAQTEGPTAAPAETGDEGPFSLAALAPLLEALPGAATVKGILEKAGQVWDQIGGSFDRLMTAFRTFFANLAGQMTEILDGFAAQGLGYIPTLVRMILGDDVFEIVEPLVNYMSQSGEALLDLFTTNPPPTDLANVMPWVWSIVSGLFGLAAGSLGGFVDAVRQMLSNLGPVTQRLVNRAVDDGWIGVKRHHYYVPLLLTSYHFMAAAEFKLNIPNVISMSGTPPGFLFEPSGAVALCLYELLEDMGVPVTYAGWNDEVGDAYNDRWRGEGARG